ncbi:hypothetical protein B0H13DRAFT_1921717 [Mycena leptocephala]|nr:hypothetical protein B0H13DRAFT_1921717 [Mycena leptocephala]
MVVPCSDEEITNVYMAVRRKQPPVPSSSVIDMGIGRILVDKFPNTRIPLEFSYTIIFVPSTYTLPGSVNKCPVFRCEKQWYGNILVVKHGKRKPVINMEAEDASLVDNIVNATIDSIPAVPLECCVPLGCQPRKEESGSIEELELPWSRNDHSDPDT